jgi:hypothetical protein
MDLPYTIIGVPPSSGVPNDLVGPDSVIVT